MFLCYCAYLYFSKSKGIPIGHPTSVVNASSLRDFEDTDTEKGLDKRDEQKINTWLLLRFDVDR